MAASVQQEISLFDLWQVLVQQKKVILFVWIVCTLIGAAYAFVATPIYKVEAYLLPPSPEDIQPLNIQALDRSNLANMNKYDTGLVYDLFVQSLKSRSNRQSFYDRYQIAEKLGLNKDEDPNNFFEKAFNEKLKVSRNVKKKEDAGFVSLSFEGKDAELAAQWVNAFVQTTSDTLSKNLASEVQAKVDALKLNTRDLIEGKKQLAKIRREDRITALKEAVSISDTLNEDDQRLKSGGLAMNTEELPLYMLSVPALQAEIKTLQQRKDDAPFIDGLRNLEEYLVTLEKINIDSAKVKPVFIDQKAFVPKKASKPNKKLIIILAGLLGLMLGVMSAFVMHTIRNKKGVKSEE